MFPSPVTLKEASMAQTAITKICAHCLYSIPNDKTSVVCRRYPPSITKVENLQITCFFPILAPNHWCGEWKARPRETKQ